MARPANEPTKMLRKLATQIQTNLESLVDQYDAQLAERPGYNRLPETRRRLLEGQLLDTIAEALNTGDSHELVQYVRQRALEWAALGFELAWFQESLSVPENLLVPLIDSVAASTFLWQALNRSQGAVWQIAAERTQATEHTLRQSQQLLQAVMDNIPQAVFWKDQNLTYLGCNRAFAEDAGLTSPAQVVGKTDWDMPWKEQAELYRADDRSVMDTGTAKINYEEPQTSPTGEQTWLRTSKVPMRDATGQVTAVLGMYEDITERRTVESVLARERNLLRTLIDTLPDQIFVKDAQGHIILHNEADARAMGVASTAEALGKTVFDLYPQELAEIYHADDMAVIQSGQSLVNQEEPSTDETGQPRWVLTTKVPFSDPHGKPLGLVGVARDITERKRIEATLLQSEERFRRFSESTQEGLVFHENGLILDANTAVVALFGFAAPTELIGRNLLEFVTPESRALVIKQMQLEDVHPYEVDCIRQDGSIFPVETATRTYQFEGRTVRASSVRDISRRKQLEQSIRDSYDRRSREVEVTRQVAQEIATATDVDAIFPLVVKLIKERFAYYHAQIFRYDSVQDAVVLVAGYGEAGQRMLAAGHHLPMGRGVVGMSAQTGEAILATDSTLDTDWQPNPNLPDTKGELAVPIKFHDEILGILDVQSDRANALDQNDVLLLEVLAGQIAVAIANTRTLEEASTFRALADAAGQGIAFADVEGRVVYANAAIIRMFGLNDLDELVGRSVINFYPEAEHGRVQAAIGQAIQTGQWMGELNVKPIAGSVLVPTINNVFLVRDNKGQLRHIANIVTNITERKLVEQRLADAIRLAKIGYWSYDVPTDTFTFNDQFYALMRTTAEREGGYAMTSAQYAQRFVHPDDAPLVGTEIGKALAATDPDYRGEVSHRVYFGDGELGYVTVRFTIEQDAQGKTIRTSGANQDITDIRRAEEELRTSEAQLSQALQAAKLGYWSYDVPTDTFIFNDQFYALMRTTAEREGGYTMTSAQYAQRFVHPDDAPLVGIEIGKALAATDPDYRGEVSHRVYFGDGELGYVTVRFTIEQDAQGKTIRTSGANQDITDIRQAEEELRTSEAQLTEALQVAKLAYWEYDVEKDLFQFNDQFFAIFHSTVEQHGGYQLSSAYYAQHFVHPDDLPIVGVEIEKALTSTDRHYNRLLEHRILYADGGVGYITVNINIDRDEQGKILRYYGANQDITERKLAEEAVRTSEAQLTEALQVAKLAYWEYDVEKDLFQFNDQFFAIFHSTVEQHGGYQLSSAYYAQHFVHPDDLPIVGVEIEKALTSTDRHYNRLLEHRILYADGGVGYIAVNINIDRDEQGKILRYYGANQDITERKQADLERERLLRDVERRANQVEAAAEVSAAAATIVETQPLLDTIVQLAQRRFNLYHCHIFLPDEANRTFTVRACGWREGDEHFGTTEDRVIQTGATQSLVSRAVRTRQPVIVDDVRADPGWLPNPALPHVRSEIALPMIVGNEVLGVFNVHSDELAHFTEDDARALFALATQAAVALQNARLFEQTRRTAEELDLLNRRLTGDVWNAYVQRKSPEHVLWASDAVNAPAPLPGLTESLATGQLVVDEATDQSAATITAPIILRGETVGALRVRANADEVDENVRTILSSIASHIAQAAENTRLLEESEARLARERALAEATDKIRRRTEVNHILETAAAELAQYLQASTVSVRVSRADDATSD